MLSENDNYLNFSGLSKFLIKLKTLFVTKDELDDIKRNTSDLGTPTFDDNVCDYSTNLGLAVLHAIGENDEIKSKTSIFTLLSKLKKSISYIIDCLIIFRKNVGEIKGITTDINSESDEIAASSKMVHDLNISLTPKIKTIAGDSFTIYFARSGNIVTVGIVLLSTLIQSGWQDLIDVPEDFCTTYVSVGSGIDTNGNHVIAQVINNNIKIYSDTSFVAHYLQINLTYVVR